MNIHTKTCIKALIPELKKVKHFNQLEGIYDKKTPCCFGAHVAKAYTTSWYYADGRDKFYKIMEESGWTKEQVDRTMHFCGASAEPFGTEPWKFHPVRVLELLLKQEKTSRISVVSKEQTHFLIKGGENDKCN